MMELDREEKTRKRPYSPPRLTVHGDVEELTSFMRLAVIKGEDGTLVFV